jgi:2-oxoglutarate dehydrogenase E2 component (dihydrolipoamide succinyltransferase)
MPIELKVPAVGESISEVQIGTWLKKEGEQAQKDEPLVEIETDKATVEIPAPMAGRIVSVLRKAGETAAVGDVIALLEADGAATTTAPQSPAPAEQSAPAKQQPAAPPQQAAPPQAEAAPPKQPATPPTQVTVKQPAQQTPKPAPASETESLVPVGRELATSPPRQTASGEREEEVVPMTPIRRRIAQRLVEAQQTAALLTTFNEVDMSAVMELRQTHREVFQQRYDVKLGFMSFFVKAVVDALRLIPQVNAEIRGNNIVYRNYYDIGIAVGGGKGLVVPILRNAERLSFAEIEAAIADFGRRARDNKLAVDELQGGTFTISNGGIYGSLLSTPIVNPPQSGILGLHAIEERPVARNGQVVIRPMMYIALTYDHRLVDGREAVTFLKRIKEVIQEPMRMLIEV